MNRSEKHIKQSIFFAAAISIVAFVAYIVSELVGFSKLHPGVSPKTIPEVVADLPRLVGYSVLVFAGALWWKMSQKEKMTLICRKCKEPIEIERETEKATIQTCSKCGGALEELYGYYDRHPEEK